MPTFAILVCTVCCLGLINPKLTPRDLYERNGSVLALVVASVDTDKQVVVLQVKDCLKGGLAPAEVLLHAQGAEVLEVYEGLLPVGRTVVAFSGAGRNPAAVLIYLGEGSWGAGTQNKPEDWTLTRHLGQDSPESMFGTFNGRGDRLAEIMADAKHGRDFFPAVPAARFGLDVAVGTAPGAISALALHDLDADGDLDIYVCSPAGDRVFIQTGAQRFEERSEALGLGGLASQSVAIADLDGDGRVDVLAGTTVRLADGARFRAGPLLPLPQGQLVKLAFCADLDGDGLPDIVVSLVGGGLRALLNRDGGKRFEDVSEAAGLRADAALPAATGFVSWGDWDQDGRVDLFFAAGSGRLLVQDASGRFLPTKVPGGWDFRNADGVQGATGGGCFAPLWRADRSDVITTGDGGLVVVANDGGRAVEVVGYGNEISETVPSMVATLAEDLDADGQLDLFSLSADGAGILHLNRGYGSFIVPHKYDKELFAGEAALRPATAAVAGDVDGDGANDLLLGDAEGRVTLVPNSCLSLRRAEVDAVTLGHDDRLRRGIALIPVTLRPGRGVLGAELTLSAADGRVVARRLVGSQVGVGCSGPDTITFAVREPGTYRVTLRLSNGQSSTTDVTCAAGALERLTLPTTP